MKEIYTKLETIQTQLNVPKAQFNQFGGYAYRSCEDILEALKPHLKEHGLVLLVSDVIENIGDRNYVKATVTLTDGTEKIIVSAYAREAEVPKAKTDEAQLTGATSSYARKYALNGLFLIDDNKDSDSTNKHDQVAEVVLNPSKATNEQQEKLKKLWDEKHFGKLMPTETSDMLKKLTPEKADELVSKWKESKTLTEEVNGVSDETISEVFGKES